MRGSRAATASSRPRETEWAPRRAGPNLRRAACHPDPDLRHAAALEFGRELALHFTAGGVDLPSWAPPRAQSRAERLLRARDWMRLEDAYEGPRPRPQEVLDLRYGLAPASPERLTQDEVAKRLGISRSRVGR